MHKRSTSMIKLQWLSDNVEWNEWWFSSHTMYRMVTCMLEVQLLNFKDTWIRESYDFYVTKTYEMESCIISLRLLESWDVDFHDKIATLRVLSCMELEKLQLCKTYNLRNLRLVKLSTWETFNMQNLRLMKHSTWETLNFRNLQTEKLLQIEKLSDLTLLKPKTWEIGNFKRIIQLS